MKLFIFPHVIIHNLKPLTPAPMLLLQPNPLPAANRWNKNSQAAAWEDEFLEDTVWECCKMKCRSSEHGKSSSLTLVKVGTDRNNIQEDWYISFHTLLSAPLKSPVTSYGFFSQQVRALHQEFGLLSGPRNAGPDNRTWIILRAWRPNSASDLNLLCHVL